MEIRTDSTVEKEIDDINARTENNILNRIEIKLKNTVKKIIKAEREEFNSLVRIIKRQLERNINTENSTLTKYIKTYGILKNEIDQIYKRKEYLNEIYQNTRNKYSVYKTISAYIKDLLFMKNTDNGTTNPEMAANQRPISSDFKFIKESIRKVHELFTKEHYNFYKTYKRLHGMFYWLIIFSSVKDCGKKRLDLLLPLHIPPSNWDVILLEFITHVLSIKNFYNMISKDAGVCLNTFHFIPITKMTRFLDY
ncbi:hypothetical protein CANINC_001701 [Pichia inconspicua]|uniref:Uncharacterized protein n=1 Tax=Pichia inconspicua TaxID=52247 RepID=A0A4T0X457_9ASCO|nr:hypothetical protein CANINC_001701 [[Candida] inconspicua]